MSLDKTHLVEEYLQFTHPQQSQPILPANVLINSPQITFTFGPLMGWAHTPLLKIGSLSNRTLLNRVLVSWSTLTLKSSKRVEAIILNHKVILIICKGDGNDLLFPEDIKNSVQGNEEF